jgi:hypothetical protein
LGKVVICSVVPHQTITRESGFGMEYILRGKNRDEEYVSLAIEDEHQFKDWGEGRHDASIVPAQDVANDLVRSCSSPGVFICAGTTPTKFELDAARERQHKHFVSLIDEADQEWSRSHDFRRINSTAKLAARELGIRRDWALDVTGMIQCAACGDMIAPSSIKCPKPNCGAILNWEKAFEYGLVTEEAYDARLKLLVSPRVQAEAPRPRA